MGTKPYYFSVMVDKAWANRFKALAYRKGISASELIRRVVESYMKQQLVTGGGQNSVKEGKDVEKT